MFFRFSSLLKERFTGLKEHFFLILLFLEVAHPGCPERKKLSLSHKVVKVSFIRQHLCAVRFQNYTKDTLIMPMSNKSWMLKTSIHLISKKPWIIVYRLIPFANHHTGVRAFPD